MHDTLQQVFGYPQFRTGQEDTVSAVLAGRSAARQLAHDEGPAVGGLDAFETHGALLVGGATLEGGHAAVGVLLGERGRVALQAEHEHVLVTRPRGHRDGQVGRAEAAGVGL